MPLKTATEVDGGCSFIGKPNCGNKKNRPSRTPQVTAIRDGQSK